MPQPSSCPITAFEKCFQTYSRKNIFRMSDQENEGMEQDIEEPVDDLGTDEPTVITSGEAPDDADSDDETGKAVPKDKRITVSTRLYDA